MKYAAILFLALTAYGQFTNEASLLEVQQEVQQLEESQQQNILMIKVNDEYYYSEGKESEIYGRCGVMDGKITSTVKENEIPQKNDESNFGEGYGYQYGYNAIEVNIDGKWIVFEKQNIN